MIIYKWQEMSYSVYQELTQAERMRYERLNEEEIEIDLGCEYDEYDIWGYYED